MKTLGPLLAALTYDDLDQWAGAKIRARGEDYIDRVDSLSRTAEGELAAWVAGTNDYATLVRLGEQGQHAWLCTCPYEFGGPCKHAVAVILAAARQVKRKRDIPLLHEDDELHLMLFSDQDDGVSRDGDWPGNGWPDGKGGRKNSKLRQLLAGKSREELLEMVLGLAASFPEVERMLLETEQLASGQIKPLLRTLRREIVKLTEEPAWSNHWSDEGGIPDYSHVRQQFSLLLAAGHADALLELGDELWRRGIEQVEQSNDEGEAGYAIAECMDIVTQALPSSSLGKEAQLLWLIDRLLQDEYNLLRSGEKMLDDGGYGAEDWRQVATELEKRTERAQKDSQATTVLDFSVSWRQIRLQKRLITAYRRSGQTEKIVPLMENSVDRLGNYSELADLLIEEGDFERARQCCVHGFARTVGNEIGTAVNLQERLRHIATARRQHELVAAHRAEEFFYRPRLESYKELRQATESLACWPAVRVGALAYLEKGKRPDLPARKGDPVFWPLSEPEVRYPAEKPQSRRDRFPDRATLIDIAIFEKRFDDVVALYQAMAKEPFGTSRDVDQNVAKAVAKTHPDVALAIWRRLIDALIAQVKPRAYVEAGGFLRMMCRVFADSKRQAEWNTLLADLRRTHKAKRRLLEVLDSLNGNSKKIIDG